jgi:hypothetical protein
MVRKETSKIKMADDSMAATLFLVTWFDGGGTSAQE